jgi:predicted lactoylglutathione lyase
MKISLPKLEEILTKVDYPKDKLQKFKEKFAETFFTKLGYKLQNDLTSDQKEKLSEIVANDNATLKDVSEYLKTLDLQIDKKQNTQEVLNEMLNYSLKQIIDNAASPEELVIINQVLQEN